MPPASPGYDASPKPTSGKLHRLRRNSSPLSEWHVTRQVSGAVVSTLSWCGVRVPDAPTLRDRERGSHGAWLQVAFPS